MNFLIFIWLLIGVGLLAFYNAYLILDTKTPDNTEEDLKIKNMWHMIGATIFIYISITSAFLGGVKFIPLGLSLFWGVFAAIIHKIALNKPMFFVGTTAKTDKLIRKYFPNNPEKASMYLKLGSVVISLLFVLFY